MTLEEQLIELGESIVMQIEGVDLLLVDHPTFIPDVRNSLVLAMTWTLEMNRVYPGAYDEIEVPEGLTYSEEVEEVPSEEVDVIMEEEVNPLVELEDGLQEILLQFGLIMMTFIKTDTTVPVFITSNVQRHLTEATFYLKFELTKQENENNEQL